MWRRTYLFLVLVRLWFALSPSYLHPDENFQGPEVIAGTCPGSVLQRRTAPGVPGVAQRPPLHPPLAAMVLTLRFCNRGNLQLPSPAHLGIYERQPDTKRIPTMARLRAADAPAAVAMDRKRE